MATRNTYEKKTKCQQVLKRKGQARGNFVVSGWCWKPFLQSPHVRREGGGDCRDLGRRVKCEFSRGLYFRNVQWQSFWKNGHHSR